MDKSESTDSYISIKEYNKISKYKDLEIDMEKMCLLKTTTVSVIVGVLGMIKKGMDKHINKKHSWFYVSQISYPKPIIPLDVSVGIFTWFVFWIRKEYFMVVLTLYEMICFAFVLFS